MQAGTGSAEVIPAATATAAPRRRFTQRKVLMTLAALGATAGIAGLATFATFTSTTTAVTPTITSGTVSITLGATGASSNRLVIGATLLAAGDSVQRTVDLINGGDLDLASISLATTAVASSVLDTPATADSLHMVIDSCAGGWTETGSSAPFTYTCGASPVVVVASMPVLAAATDLPSLAALHPSGTDHLRVTLTLPQTAGNSYMGKSSTLSYAFTGTQRNATAK